MSNTVVTPEFASLREKIAYEKAERLARYERFAEIFQAATEAGWDAHEAALPRPMVVSSATTDYYVSEGLCGFGWVTVNPGTSSFARWLVKTGRARAAHRGGVQIWVGTQSQSYERKSAYAQAMADVLKSSPELAGLRIFPGGRLD